MDHRQDHFSAIAKEYSKGRIAYPTALYEFLAKECERKNVAWDCATGNGQAAHDLVRYFDQIIATDISSELLSQAKPNPSVEFKKSAAENSGLTADSINIVTVAQAIHWFDLEAFWKEVDRVLSTNGILAFWGYTWPIVNDEVDLILEEFKNEIKSDWPEKSRFLHASYSDINPPFSEVESPQFTIEEQWNLKHYMSHLKSWSGTRYNKERLSKNLTVEFEERFRAAWSDNSKKIRWPLILKVYRKT